MKIWPVEVWDPWRARRAQQRFLALTVKPMPPAAALRWLGRPGRNPKLAHLLAPSRRLPAAQYGNLHGSVGAELPRRPLVDWAGPPLSPEGRRAWSQLGRV